MSAFYKLHVDLTDADTIEASAQVISHLFDGNGNALTSTLVGADQALDVNIVNSSIEVTASDLDIRDLSSATDSVAAVQSGTWDIGTVASIIADVNIADGGNSITVDAIDLDIRNLSASSDNVAISDGTDTLAVNADGSINVVTTTDNSLANTAIANGTTNIGTTASDCVGSPLADRKYLWLYNNNNKKMWVGAAGVTKSDGFPMYPGVAIELRCGASVDIECVGDKNNMDLRYLELS